MRTVVPVDTKGRPWQVGDTAVKAERHGSSAPHLRFARVTDIADGKVYLDGSKVPVGFPERMLLLGRAPTAAPARIEQHPA